MLIYQEFLALNEEMPAFDPNERLRRAVYEIASKLKWNEEMKFENLSIILSEEYKIDAPTEVLKEIFTRWDRFNDPEFTIFKKEDKNWLDAWPHQGYFKRKAKKDKQNFGKHRKKDIPVYTSTGRSVYTPAAGYYRNNPYGIEFYD